MKLKALVASILTLMVAGCSTTQKQPSNPISSQSASVDPLSHRKGTLVIQAEPNQTVSIKQMKHEFWFGAALANQAFDGRMSPEDTAKYRSVFLGNFNSAVTENALKWLSMQPTEDPVNYDTVDAILEWTDTNDIPLRGHNIFWGIHKFVQPWVKELDRDTLYQTVKQRAIDVGSRYKGRFAQYDLNNEMIHGNYYEEQLGEAITLQMANWVMSEDPEAKLFLNDYDILTQARLDQFVDHIQSLLDQGVPIAGIGVQGHLHGISFDREALRYSLDTLAKFDLPIIVTEFNMPGQRSKYYMEKGKHQMTPAEEQQKAADLADYYRICFEHPAVDGILMWGFWAGANWIPESSLYSQEWNPTPALAAYRDLVFNKWWTQDETKTDSKGQLIIPAFFGTYEITSGKQRQTIRLDGDHPNQAVEF